MSKKLRELLESYKADIESNSSEGLGSAAAQPIALSPASKEDKPKEMDNSDFLKGSLSYQDIKQLDESAELLVGERKIAINLAVRPGTVLSEDSLGLINEQFASIRSILSGRMLNESESLTESTITISESSASISVDTQERPLDTVSRQAADEIRESMDLISAVVNYDIRESDVSAETDRLIYEDVSNEIALMGEADFEQFLESLVSESADFFETALHEHALNEELFDVFTKKGRARMAIRDMAKKRIKKLKGSTSADLNPSAARFAAAEKFEKENSETAKIINKKKDLIRASRERARANLNKKFEENKKDLEQNKEKYYADGTYAAKRDALEKSRQAAGRGFWRQLGSKATFGLLDTRSDEGKSKVKQAVKSTEEKIKKVSDKYQADVEAKMSDAEKAAMKKKEQEIQKEKDLEKKNLLAAGYKEKPTKKISVTPKPTKKDEVGELLDKVDKTEETKETPKPEVKASEAPKPAPAEETKETPKPEVKASEAPKPAPAAETKEAPKSEPKSEEKVVANPTGTEKIPTGLEKFNKRYNKKPEVKAPEQPKPAETPDQRIAREKAESAARMKKDQEEAAARTKRDQEEAAARKKEDDARIAANKETKQPVAAGTEEKK